MNKLVSVILPVYNSEKYVVETMKSIINQTYKNIEIILVDDGSTDETYNICNDILNSFPNKKIIRQENGGVSGARNMGIDHARGDYIFFLDSDDCLVDCAIEEMTNIAEAGAWDVVQCGSRVIKEYVEGDIINLAYYDYFCSKIYMPVVWGKLFRKEAIGHVRFDVELKIREDIDFLYRVFKNISNILCINKSYIKCGYNPEGLNKGRYRIDNLSDIKVAETAIMLYKEDEHKEFVDLLYASYCGSLLLHYNMYSKYINESEEIKDDIKQKYRRNFKEFIKVKNTLRYKIMLCLAYFSPKIFYFTTY